MGGVDAWMRSGVRRIGWGGGGSLRFEYLDKL